MKNQMQKQTEQKMREASDSFARALSKIRAGRASPSMLDEIKVEVYGSNMPLSQVATISNEDNRTLLVQVWDKGNVSAVEKGILASNLGFNPSTSGEVLRIVLPPMTEETRLGYVKQAKAESERFRITVRNIRRDQMQKAKSLEKEGEINQDDLKQIEQLIQKETDKFISEIDARLLDKEAELKQI